jgi:hypothetical protein
VYLCPATLAMSTDYEKYRHKGSGDVDLASPEGLSSTPNGFHPGSDRAGYHGASTSVQMSCIS